MDLFFDFILNYYEYSFQMIINMVVFIFNFQQKTSNFPLIA